MADKVLKKCGANKAAVKKHLGYLFKRLPEEYPGSMIEIRCIREQAGKRRGIEAELFLHIDDAATYAVEMNREGYNVYVGVNPRKPGTQTAGSTKDIEIAFFHFADIDDEHDKTYLVDHPPTFQVVTGTVPHQRTHHYWEMEKPSRDLNGSWRETQSSIADALGGDRVIDAPRIMRLAGSISYPTEKKIAKGYATETVRIVAGTGKPTTINRPEPNQTTSALRQETALIDKPDVTQVREALASLDSDCPYNEWIKTGAALYHSFGGDKSGLELWAEWSAKGAKFKPGECQKKWPTFENFVGTPATVASIFAAARESGSNRPEKQSSDWPDPSDVWDIKTYVTDDPTDCFPPVIENFARAEAERIGADAMTIGAMTLPVTAACLHADWFVYPKMSEQRYKEPLIVWVIVSMDPGQRKSAIFDAVLSPLNSIEREWGQQHRENQLVYELKKLEAKEKKQAPPDKLQMKRVSVDDTTVEALGVILSGSDGSFPVSQKVLLRVEEAATLLEGMDLYRKGQGSVRGHYLTLYDGGFRTIDRISRPSLYVNHWAACILGTIQTDKLAKVAKNLTDDGFIQRVVILTPPPVELDVDDDIAGTFDEEAVDRYGQVIRGLVAVSTGWGPEKSKGATRSGRGLKISKEAKEWRLKLRERLAPIINLQYYPSVMLGAVSKWNGLWARLAGLFEIIHQIDLGTPVDQIQTISGDAGRWAYNFIVKCVEPNAANFYLNKLGIKHEFADPMIAVAGWLITSERRECVNRREVQRANGRANLDRDSVIEIMQMLEDRGWVKTISLDKRLKPDRWEVNPRIYSDLGDRKQAETLRRAEIWHKIEANSKARRRS